MQVTKVRKSWFERAGRGLRNGGALGCALGLAMLLWAAPGRSDEKDVDLQKVVDAMSGIKFGVLAYIDYSAGQMPLADNSHQNYNQLSLTRGYFRFTKDFTPWLGGHLTTDISQEVKDTKESLAGSYILRLKYYYMYLKPKDLGPFTNLKSEIGMGHIPWLDFEESINPYRLQGTMAIERAGTFASADLGVSLMGNLGGKLEDAAKKTGNGNYDGKYGSWHLGVYNGGGYAATENNQNKVVEGRLSLRPLPSAAPGLQLSYFGLAGQGNAIVRKGDMHKYSPNYAVHLGMLSFEHPKVTATAQYFATQGNAKGTWLTSNHSALATDGYSGFLRVSAPGTKNRLSVMGRYDHFNADKNDEYSNEASYSMWLAGMSYDLYKGNLILVDYEKTDYQKDSGGKGAMPKHDNKLGDDNKVQVVFQVKL